MAIAWDLREYSMRVIHNLNGHSLEEHMPYSQTNCRRRRKERENHAPSPVPAKRKRRLTAVGNLSQPDGDAPWLRDQAQHSLLFSRLPVEVRLLIWTFVVAGSDVIHIARIRRRMAGFRCIEPDRLDERKHRCWGNYDVEYAGIYTAKRLRGVPGMDRSPASMVNALALLRTCRQVYTEAIKLLYSKNRFHFNSLEAILAFPPTILSHRFHSIQSMFMTCLLHQILFNDYYDQDIRPPHDISTWRKTWEVLRSMQGLRHLNVVLHVLSRPWETDEGGDEKIVEPIRAIKPPTQVSVTLVWGSEERADGEGRRHQIEDNIILVRQPLWHYGDKAIACGFPKYQQYDED